MIILEWSYHSICVEFIEDGVRNTLETWQPKDPLDVAVYLSVTIGERGRLGPHIFESAIYTTSNFRKRKQKFGSDFEDPNRVTVVYEYDWPKIRGKLDAVIKNCERLTEVATLTELRKHFYWEYEGDPRGPIW